MTKIAKNNFAYTGGIPHAPLRRQKTSSKNFSRWLASALAGVVTIAAPSFASEVTWNGSMGNGDAPESWNQAAASVMDNSADLTSLPSPTPSGPSSLRLSHEPLATGVQFADARDENLQRGGDPSASSALNKNTTSAPPAGNTPSSNISQPVPAHPSLPTRVSEAAPEINLAPAAGEFSVGDSFETFNSGSGGNYSQFILSDNDHAEGPAKSSHFDVIALAFIVPSMLLGLIALIPAGLGLRKLRKSIQESSRTLPQ